MSVCMLCRATQCLHCSDAVLLLQPQCKCQHQAQVCLVQGGWAREQCAAYVPYPVARPVQHEREEHDADGHALASNFVGGNRTHLYLPDGQTRIFWEGFQQGQEMEEMSWYQFYGQDSQERVRCEKHCNLCKKHGGAYTTHNTCDCRRFEKDQKQKSNFHATKKGSKKANPVNQNFAQLTKKIDKLKKALKKSGKKAQKYHHKDSNFSSK